MLIVLTPEVSYVVLDVGDVIVTTGLTVSEVTVRASELDLPTVSYALTVIVVFPPYCNSSIPIVQRNRTSAPTSRTGTGHLRGRSCP